MERVGGAEGQPRAGGGDLAAAPPVAGAVVLGRGDEAQGDGGRADDAHGKKVLKLKRFN